MIQLIKGEFKRFFKKKYIFAITILLVMLNLYIINYDYDSHLNYKYLIENTNDAMKIVEGNISKDKTNLVELEQDKIIKELDEKNYDSEEEAHIINIKRYFYSEYIDYINDSPFPLEYGDTVFENRQELIKRLKSYEEKNQTNLSAYAELNHYLNLTEIIKKDSFYVMYWDRIFQQNSLLFLMIAIIIAMATVFGDDYSNNVALLSLSSKYGKTKLIKARIITSTIFGSIIVAIFFGSEVVMKLWLNGINGYQGRVSVLNFIYTPNLSPITQLLVFFLFTILATLCLSLLTLAVSLMAKGTINTMVTMVLIVLTSETIKIPFINNLSLKNIVNNFSNSFIEYNPINILGWVLDYPLYLIFYLIILSFLALIITIYKGKKQEI